MVASTLWDRYLELTAGDIVAMKGVEQENRHIDFKLLSKPDFGADDQRHLAKAVSGFANAEGGVIVWGVDARRDPKDEHIDQVVATPGVDNPRQILARLNGLSSDATSPGLKGLDHRIIEGRDGLPSFAATFVPEGESGPYMAMLGEARHRYYRRIGSAFTPMDHSMVADMFGRRPQAWLKLSFFTSGGRALAAELENRGRGAAVAPYLLFSDVQAPFRVVPYEGPNFPAELPRTSPGSQAEFEGFAGGMTHLIHPGLRLRIGVLTVQPGTSRTGSTHCRASFRYGAVGVAAQEGSFVFNFESGRFEMIEGAVGIAPP
jgi:hypothetical protein